LVFLKSGTDEFIDEDTPLFFAAFFPLAIPISLFYTSISKSKSLGHQIGNGNPQRMQRQGSRGLSGPANRALDKSNAGT
jgi:hypothetical protein